MAVARVIHRKLSVARDCMHVGDNTEIKTTLYVHRLLSLSHRPLFHAVIHPGKLIARKPCCAPDVVVRFVIPAPASLRGGGSAALFAGNGVQDQRGADGNVVGRLVVVGANGL